MEAAGLATISLSNIPELTASASVPRIAAIEYPTGRSLGEVGDQARQTAVLRATLGALAEIDTPGEIRHLPFEWPYPKRKTVSHAPQLPPIAAYLRRHPWHYPKFLARQVPE